MNVIRPLQPISPATGPAAGLALAPSPRLAGRVIALAVLLLCATVGFVSHTALRAFEDQVRPELEREALVVGRIGAGTLQRALDLGVPFERLTGTEEYLGALFAARAGLAYVVLKRTDGTSIAASGLVPDNLPPLTADVAEAASFSRLLGRHHDVAVPLREAGAVVAWVHVGIDRVRIESALDDMRWDIIMVLLVVLLATSEFLRFIVAGTVTAPIAMVLRVQQRLAGGDWTVQADGGIGAEAGRVARHLNVLVRRMNDRWARLVWLAQDAGGRTQALLADVAGRLRFGPAQVVRLGAGTASARLPLFLFVFAEQLSTSFIPLHAQSLSGGGTTFAAALPIASFVAAVALMTPWGGTIVARHGARSAMIRGILLAAAGHAAAAVMQDAVGFALARAVAGAGYAVVTIACQVHLAQEAPTGRMAQSLGGFTGAVMTGAVCGTAIGAVIADRVGFAMTFGISALLVLGLAVLVWHAFDRDESTAIEPPGLWRSARAALSEPRFVALVVLAAIPAKILLGGFIFFLVPLALRETGLGQAAIGRHVMLYGLCMLPAIALGAWLADRTGRGGLIIAVAGVANGLGLLLPLWLDIDLALPVAIIITGLAQGLAAAPMLAIIPGLSLSRGAPPSAAMLGFLRLAERFGSVVGPPAAAGLLALGGGAQAMLVLGAISLAAALGYALALLPRWGLWHAR